VVTLGTGLFPDTLASQAKDATPALVLEPTADVPVDPASLPVP